IFGFPSIPYDFQIERSTLIILNEKGRELWRFNSGVENLQDDEYYHFLFNFKTSENSGRRRLPLIIIKDINYDGKPEVLFAINTKNEFKSKTLFCIDHNGKELWRFDAGREIQFGQDLFSTDFTIYGFIIDDIDFKLGSEIIVISNAVNRFATQVCVLNVKGEKLGDYWNSGQLNDCVTVDLEQDGKKEILVSGVNNEYGKGCLIVLDADHLGGGSPQSVEEYIATNLEPGKEKHYLLLPRTDLDLNIDVQQSAFKLDLAANNKIAVTVSLTTLIYYFDFNLHPLSVTLSNNFHQLQADEEKQGKFFSLSDNELTNKLISEIQYWNGKYWTNIPSQANSWIR
ncbi:hypothetical protein ACFLQZ_02975, partial [Acidobacteriota bacterium]